MTAIAGAITAGYALAKPMPPDFSKALCTSKGADPAWWTDNESPGRSRAIAICLTPCPCLQACRAFALTLPPSAGGIWGGWSASERRRQRKAQAEATRELARQQASAPPAGMALRNARKETCKNGHPLTGDNLRITRSKRGSGTRRVCRACHREMSRSAMRLSRRLARQAASAA